MGGAESKVNMEWDGDAQGVKVNDTGISERMNDDEHTARLGLHEDCTAHDDVSMLCPQINMKMVETAGQDAVAHVNYRVTTDRTIQKREQRKKIAAWYRYEQGLI